MARTNRWLRFGLIAIAAAALYLPFLGRPALWEPDEGRYAEIAREMVVTGDYVTPRDDQQRYFEKPPLVYWAEAAAIEAFGANEFAVRLPSALCSVAQVVVTSMIAEAMLGPEAGMLAAMTLALSPLFFGFARFATLDPALAFFLTAAIGSFYAAAREPTFESRRARLWMIVAAAMLALGTLTKGPVALVLGGTIAFGWLIVEKRTREISKMPIVGCAIVYVAIVVPWFALAESRNPGFLRFFFIHEHLKRYFQSSEHGWGPWFFVPIVIGGTWPWIFFAPSGFREMYSTGSADNLSRRSDARLLAIWFGLIFILFSIPRSKLGSYILPGVPPIAIAAGYGLARLRALSAVQRERVLRWFVAINAIGAVAGAALALDLIHPIHPSLAWDAVFVALFILVGAIMMYGTAREEGRVGYGAAALALALIATIGLSERARRDATPLTSYRDLASVVRPYLQKGCVLGSYRHYVQSLPFYTGSVETRVEYWGELAETGEPEARDAKFLIGSEAKLKQSWASGSCMVLIVNRRDLSTLAPALAPAPSIIGCEGKKIAIYNGHPDSAPTDCAQERR